MNDFKSEPKELRNEMLEAFNRVLESGWYVLGKEVQSFEKQWADFCGLNFSVGVGNGMDAIEIALRSLDIGYGDEVITTSMTAVATVLAIVRAGAIPVLADIDEGTALLNIESVERCISPKTKAILLVHLYGQIKNMDAWTDLCQKYDISLIEDCAQAHQANINGKFAGSYGVVGAYSFYPTKNLGTIGDAGIIVTNSQLIADRAKRIRNYGQSERYHHPELGLNSRLDELHAAILNVRLKWLSTFNNRRREIADRYRNELKNSSITLLSDPIQSSSHVYHLYVINCQWRDYLQNFLKSEGIETLIHYPICAHNQPPFTTISRDPKGLTVSEKHALTCLSLPCHPYMSESDITSVVHAVNKFRPI